MNTPQSETTAPPLRVPIANVVSKYFGGDADFFATYQAACVSQFPIDLQTGAAASAALDTDGLMRTAHNLRSILLSLGFTSLSEEAATCEHCSQRGQVELAQASWDRLALYMTAVLTSGALAPQALN